MAEPVRISPAGRAAQRALERDALACGADRLTDRRAAFEADLRRHGVDFRPESGAGYFRRFGEDGPIRADPVPYVMTVADRQAIASAYEQRLHVFDDLVRALADRDESVVPAHILQTLRYDREALATLAGQPRAVTFAGSDAMVDEAGRVLLVEDNPCVAAGSAFGALMHETSHRTVPEFDAYDSEPPIDAGAGIRRIHEGLCDSVTAPAMIYVTHGPAEPNFAELVVVAQSAGFILADPEDVSVAPDGTVWLQLSDGRRKIIDLVYCNLARRFRLSAQLLDAAAKGTARVVNHPATFVLTDKYLFPSVADLVVRRFGASARLDQAHTIPLLEAADRRAVLADLRDYVIKPRGGLGGQGVVIGRTASDAAIAEISDLIERRPDGYLAQPRVAAGTTLTLTRGGGPSAPETFARSVFDLRISGYAGSRDAIVHEPLVRADLVGHGLVNLSAGGALKANYRVNDRGLHDNDRGLHDQV